jgi:hypothetical protein
MKLVDSNEINVVGPEKKMELVDSNETNVVRPEKL